MGPTNRPKVKCTGKCSGRCGSDGAQLGRTSSLKACLADKVLPLAAEGESDPTSWHVPRCGQCRTLQVPAT